MAGQTSWSKVVVRHGLIRGWHSLPSWQSPPRSSGTSHRTWRRPASVLTPQPIPQALKRPAERQ